VQLQVTQESLTLKVHMTTAHSKHWSVVATCGTAKS